MAQPLSGCNTLSQLQQFVDSDQLLPEFGKYGGRYLTFNDSFYSLNDVVRRVELLILKVNEPENISKLINSIRTLDARLEAKYNETIESASCLCALALKVLLLIRRFFGNTLRCYSRNDVLKKLESECSYTPKSSIKEVKEGANGRRVAFDCTRVRRFNKDRPPASVGDISSQIMDLD